MLPQRGVCAEVSSESLKSLLAHPCPSVEAVALVSVSIERALRHSAGRRCRGCSVGLVPGLTCSVTLRQSRTRRKNGKGPRIASSCQLCGSSTLLGGRAVSLKERKRDRLEAVDPSTIKHRLRSRKKKNRRGRMRETVSVQAAKELGKMVAASTLSARPMTLLEKLEANQRTKNEENEKVHEEEVKEKPGKLYSFVEALSKKS